MSQALDEVLPALTCPTCGARLHRDDASLRCRDRHTFDIARQGYVSLLATQKARSGDDAEMARARERFLGSGAYTPLRRAVADLAAPALRHAAAPDGPAPLVVEAGCGTGYYLAGVLDTAPRASGFGFDTSRRSVRTAAHAHPRAAAATWDVFRPLPIADRAARVVLDVFSPRNPPEFQRILAADGLLVVARPAAEHLHELYDALPGMVAVDPEKETRLDHALGPCFELQRTELVTFPVGPLTRDGIADLIGMTPSARHLAREAVEESHRLPDIVTAAVLVSAYRPRSRPEVGSVRT